MAHDMSASGEWRPHEQWEEIVDRALVATPTTVKKSDRKTLKPGAVTAPRRRTPREPRQPDPWATEGAPWVPPATAIVDTLGRPSWRAAVVSRSGFPDRPWGSAIRREIIWGVAFAASIAALVLLLASEVSFVFPLAVFLVGGRALHNFWIAGLETRVRAPRPRPGEARERASGGDSPHEG
jgi:hypothetical protein